MTPTELYESPFISETFDLLDVLGWSDKLFPEVYPLQERLESQKPTLNTRVKMRVHGYQYIDHKRYHALVSFWFDDVPFMVNQQAGRYGEDVFKRFISDRNTYESATAYLRTLPTNEDFTSAPDIVAVDADLGNLADFNDREIEIGKETPRPYREYVTY